MKVENREKMGKHVHMHPSLRASVACEQTSLTSLIYFSLTALSVSNKGSRQCLQASRTCYNSGDS